jgi:hypothetical protein
MTPDEARDHIGDRVIYSTVPGQAETGVIDSANDSYAFVRYGLDLTAKATRPEFLTLMRGGSLDEHMRLNMAESGFPVTGPQR